MKTEKLNTQFRLVNKDDCWSVVEFYEKNKDYFNDLNQYFFLKDFENLVLIFNRYIKALGEIGKYKLALKKINKFEIILQNLKEKKSQYYSGYYKNYIFYKGDFYFKIRNYKKAFELFKELRELEPENKKYKEQFFEIKFKILQHIANRVGILFIVSFLIGFICKELKILNNTIAFQIELFGLISFFITIITVYISSVLMKRQSKK